MDEQSMKSDDEDNFFTFLSSQDEPRQAALICAMEKAVEEGLLTESSNRERCSKLRDLFALARLYRSMHERGSLILTDRKLWAPSSSPPRSAGRVAFQELP